MNYQELVGKTLDEASVYLNSCHECEGHGLIGDEGKGSSEGSQCDSCGGWGVAPNKTEIRVSKVDGKVVRHDLAFSPNRINVCVDNGIITEVTGVG